MNNVDCFHYGYKTAGIELLITFVSTIYVLGRAYVHRRSWRSCQLDVHVFDLRREVRPHLGPFHFERRRQQAVLHGERVRV